MPCMAAGALARFTHVDPFEDTERVCGTIGSLDHVLGFTHVDPFEDTESWHIEVMKHERLDVSPTSIRSRILKENGVIFISGEVDSFTHVDPFEDTERSPGQCRT